tara:strand:- start:8 stop:601 length:594 start_codon:yes stop_codon:yes gene_type:complete
MKLRLTLTEAKQSKYNTVLEMLKGKDPSVKTVTIMSGQNPNAQQVIEPINKKLKGDLESRLKEMNLQFVRVGGKFFGVFEQSVIVINPDLQEIAKLNKEFGQWGFLYGEKFTIEPGNDTMLFTMYQIDYEGDSLFFRASGSARVSDVLDDSQLQGQADDFTFIPKSQQGDDPESRVGKKFNIPVYEGYKLRGIDERD